jgi:pimeloyl-ACP methyl ester carboxylesterase
METSIYKSESYKTDIMRLYDQRLKACNIDYEEFYVDTFAGKTHVIATGDKANPPLFILHGINAGAPMAIEAIKGLNKTYCIYAIDTVGQATKSAETRLAMNDDSYARWINEAMDKLNIQTAVFIGVSYGAFLLQKLMTFYPDRISKGIFVVPSGFVNGPFLKSMQKLTFPLIRFLSTKTEKSLVKFMDAFYSEIDIQGIAFQKNVLLGVKVDYRRPTLLTAKEIKALKAPVYAMVADNDIFFPGDKTLERAKNIFSNFKGSHVLRNTKHIPAAHTYAEIENQLKKWLVE